MVVRRRHSRTPLERYGQVNYRANQTPQSLDKKVVEEKASESEQRNKIPRHMRGGHELECVIVVSKRKGWGTTGNNESQPYYSSASAEVVLSALDPKQFERYRVNVYLKK
jgi:hypothetical protein